MSVRGFVTRQLAGFEREFVTLNRIEIDSSRILSNFDVYKNLSEDGVILPVLKSNAYGHGIDQIVSILKQREFPYFVVDGYFEALRIWETWHHPVLLIGYTDPLNFKQMKTGALAFAVWDFDTVRALNRLGGRINVHLKIDTGMHRQGVLVHDLPDMMKFINSCEHINIEGVMSHFADADGDDESYTKMQLRKFNEALDVVLNMGRNHDIRYVHIGASAGAVKSVNSRVNTVRPGIGLYGYNPLLSQDGSFSELTSLEPALSLFSKVVTMKSISRGDAVSYNCTYTAKKEMKIGVLPLGYYEALDRRLSNRGVVIWKGKELPIVGRVCMNLTVIDLGNEDISLLDEVTVISSEPSRQNSIFSIAEECGTIPYEILVNLSESIRRLVV